MLGENSIRLFTGRKIINPLDSACDGNIEKICAFWKPCETNVDSTMPPHCGQSKLENYDICALSFADEGTKSNSEHQDKSALTDVSDEVFLEGLLIELKEK